MFGNQKMYKKGLADAMSAYEGFSEKQQAALEQLRQQVANGTDAAFDGLSEDLNGIYQYLSRQEKAALYQLDNQMDLKELEDQERRLLLAVLYQLAEDEGSEATEAQRAFIRSVQRYLEVTNPQTGVDLSVVGEIDSLDVQKLFLRVVLEFFYLRDGDEITEEQDEFLSNFSVNRKQASAIEASVSRLYNIVGAEGIAEKYGYVAEEEAAVSEEPEAAEEPDVPSVSNVQEVVVINGVLFVDEGQERIFENKHIYLGAAVGTEGNLIFKECTIEFVPNPKWSDDDFELSFECYNKQNSKLRFENCLFTMQHGVDPSRNEKTDPYFVFFKGAEVIECTFCDGFSATFANGTHVTKSSFIKMYIWGQNSEIVDCTFTHLQVFWIYGGLHLSNCKFQQICLDDLYGEDGFVENIPEKDLAIIYILLKNSSGVKNRIEYCLFDDIELSRNGFLIAGECRNDNDTRVTRCKFTNIRTTRRDKRLAWVEVIEKKKLFRKAPEPRRIEVVDPFTCTGLNDTKIIES